MIRWITFTVLYRITSFTLFGSFWFVWNACMFSLVPSFKTWKQKVLFSQASRPNGKSSAPGLPKYSWMESANKPMLKLPGVKANKVVLKFGTSKKWNSNKTTHVQTPLCLRVFFPISVSSCTIHVNYIENKNMYKNRLVSSHDAEAMSHVSQQLGGGFNPIWKNISQMDHFPG